ncbi:hypothetical protein D8S78_06775 [Natrialba swarupiae]|nr:hypothetical protein [Natrialba swarupiae]
MGRSLETVPRRDEVRRRRGREGEPADCRSEKGTGELRRRRERGAHASEGAYARVESRPQ